LAVAIAAAFVIVGVGAAQPSLRGIEPVTMSGNIGCKDLAGLHTNRSVKFEPPTIGESGGIVILNPGPAVEFYPVSSNTYIEAVIVKGGPFSNVYRYPYPVQHWSDSGLVAPMNAKKGTAYDVGKVEFCYSTS